MWFFHVKWALNPNKDTAHSNLASKFSYREPNVLFLIPSKIQKIHQKKKITFVLLWNTLVESPFEDVSYSAPLSGWSLIFFFGNLKCYFWSHQNCTKGRKLFLTYCVLWTTLVESPYEDASHSALLSDWQATNGQNMERNQNFSDSILSTPMMVG